MSGTRKLHDVTALKRLCNKKRREAGQGVAALG